jgi:hypothetical protein
LRRGGLESFGNVGVLKAVPKLKLKLELKLELELPLATAVLNNGPRLHPTMSAALPEMMLLFLSFIFL